MLGLRTTIYKVGDIKEATLWYGKAFLKDPYFNKPYYVGFNIGGYELGLQPEDNPVTDKVPTVISYWGVSDIAGEYQRLIDLGALENNPPTNVGGPVVVASVKDPWGNIIGLIYNPVFKIQE